MKSDRDAAIFGPLLRREIEVRVEGQSVAECDDAALTEIIRILSVPDGPRPWPSMPERIGVTITPERAVVTPDGVRWTYEGRYRFLVIG